jgi:formylglycine-generating enzyme required for sulfatase activity
MPLVGELQRRGWSVWWDRTIRPGKTWDQVIEAALTEARCVIVLWSRDSIQSDWVRTEADEARQRGILVPALLDDVVIPLAFRRMQAARLVQWSSGLANTEFDELIRAVTEVLSDGVHAAPEPKARVASAQRPDPVPVTARRRHVWSFGSSRRTMAAIGAVLLVCVAGSAWYFASSHRESSKSPGIEPASNQAREDPKAEPAALPAPASSSPEGAAASRQPRNNAKDGLKYVWIPPGTFTMGCSPGDNECDSDEKPAHKVTITAGFWMGQTPVTQQAYQHVVGADPSHFKGPQLPVETVNWNEAQSYCQAVGMRLPTEAEWEYAARAGTTDSRYGDLDSIAWYEKNSGNTTHPVGLKQANAFGLYDMLGNVYDWTSDYYNPNTKVVRGGSWGVGSGNVRVSFHNGRDSSLRLSYLGFRCVGELR